MSSLGIDGYWIGIHDADPRANALYKRHYSNRKRENRKGNTAFGGIGEKMVLLTVDGLALFVWRPQSMYFADLVGQSGIVCSIFRNEGPILSSLLIIEAMDLAWQRWPGQRLYTYVWDAKVESVNPGYCFKMAGWRTCGRNKDGRLTILEALPQLPYRAAVAVTP